MSKDSQTLAAVRSTGQEVDEFPIAIGPRFLELFSENLYSSPNKAFEELVANSWDANATAVYVSIPDDIKAESVCIWVLDNGHIRIYINFWFHPVQREQIRALLAPPLNSEAS